MTTNLFDFTLFYFKIIHTNKNKSDISMIKREVDPVLAYLGIETYQEIQQYIKSVAFKRETKEYLNESLSFIESCYLLFLIIHYSCEILEGNNQLHVEIKFRASDMKIFNDLRKYYPTLLELLDKSQEDGFNVVVESQEDFINYVRNKKKELH